MLSHAELLEKRAKWESVGLSGGGGMFTPVISPHDPSLIIVNCDMSCAFRSTDAGESWEMIHHGYLIASTRCRPVFHPTDPNVIFAANGYRGDLRVSRDRGETWQPLGDGLSPGLRSLAVDPGNPDLMLAACWEGVYRSADGGEHWEKARGVSESVVGFHIDQTSPPGGRRCFAGTDEGAFVSEDGGATWKPAGEGLPRRDMHEFTGGSNAESGELVLYCSLETDLEDDRFVGGVYRSLDGGATWEPAMGEGIDSEARKVWGHMRTPEYPFIVTTNERPRTVYAGRGRPSQIYRSDDAGQTWRPTLFTRTDEANCNLEINYLMAELGGSESNLSGMGISPADPEMVITTDWMCCQITRDGGGSWETLHTKPAPGQEPVGKGARWINTGLVVTTVWHYYVDPFEPNRHYMAYTDIKFARSEDAGKTWYSQWEKPLRNTTYELAFDPEVPGKIWGAFADLHDIPNNNVISGRHYWERAAGGVGVSEDSGATWRDSSEGLPEKPVTSVVLDAGSPRDARTLYASLFEGGVYKSVDGGNVWEQKSEGLGAPEKNMRCCRLILHEDGTLFCLVTALLQDDEYQPEGPGLYRSKDGGESWECITESQPLLWPKDFDVDPRDSDVIYLGAADAGDQRQGGLYKTTDGGRAWQRIAREGRETFGATVHPRRPDWVYMCICEAAPGPGLWLSKDGGETWEPFWGIPFRNIQRVSFDPTDDSVIYVCTFGGSVWKGPPEP